MTRKEQIEKAAFDYINSDVVSPENMQLAFGDFINGAKWADKTMLEKACNWLMLYGCEYATEEVMVEHFCKAMEE